MRSYPPCTPIMRKFLSGVPVELTDASPETAELYDILDNEGTLFFGTIYETDLGGAVYWSKDRKVAVFVPTR